MEEPDLGQGGDRDRQKRSGMEDEGGVKRVGFGGIIGEYESWPIVGTTSKRPF